MAYVWALLTDRQLSIRITKPCPITQLLIPNEIDWDKPIENFDYNNNNNSKFTSVHVNKIDSLYYYNEFKNLNLIQLHKNQSLITLNANLDLIKSLAENPSLKKKLLLLYLRLLFYISY